MSCDYASGLSEYANKGVLGLPESFDSPEEISRKVDILAKWMSAADHAVFHTGAGISTSAGIPDFRGPKGVWTLEKKGLKPDQSLDWDEAVPTKTHMAIKALVDRKTCKFVVSQNIDGLHLRSGIPREYLAELHGNMFVEKCGICLRMFVRPSPSETVGQKTVGDPCPGRRPNGRPCRGKVHDFTLDWEDKLPDDDLDLSDAHSALGDLSVVLGSTLQIIPSGTLPTYSKKYESVRPTGGKLVIINLQPTKHDRKADLIIRGYVDEVMSKLFNTLGIDIPEYNTENDPIRIVAQMRSRDPDFVIDWTQDQEKAKGVVESSDRLDGALKRKRKAEKEAIAAKIKKEEYDTEKAEEGDLKDELKVNGVKEESSNGIELA